MTTPTRHRGVFTVDPDNLLALLRDITVTPTVAIASIEVAEQLGPLPQLPPGRLRDCVTAESAAAGVAECAVTLVVLALLDAAVPPGMLPPIVRNVELPATWIVGSAAECFAVLAAAEAVVASRRGRAG